MSDWDLPDISKMMSACTSPASSEIERMEREIKEAMVRAEMDKMKIMSSPTITVSEPTISTKTTASEVLVRLDQVERHIEELTSLLELLLENKNNE